MTIKTIITLSKVYGTNAERLAMNLAAGDTEIEFYETDTGNSYLYKGSEWVQTSINGAARVTQSTLTSGEDQTNNVVRVEGQSGYEVIARTTTDVIAGTLGAVGDLLVRVIVQVVPTTASLIIYDGTSATGTAVLTIPTTATIGQVFEVGAVALTNWQVGLHATGAGTVSMIGRFS